MMPKNHPLYTLVQDSEDSNFDLPVAKCTKADPISLMGMQNLGHTYDHNAELEVPSHQHDTEN